MKKNESKLRVLFSDSVYSIAALVIMNMMAQFAVYPAWSKQFGPEFYGDILYLLSFINIYSVSVGMALNYARLANSAKFKTENGEYHLILLLMAVLGIPFSFLVKAYSGVSMAEGEEWIFWILLCTTMVRNYADVDFRLGLNYKGYFKYYLSVSIGYGIGIFLCRVTGIWELGLLVGEMMGMAYVFVFGDYLRKHTFRVSGNLKQTVYSCLIMVSTHFIMNLIFNADRFMLKALIGGTAVTIYYLSSLLGKTVSLITTPLNSVIISYLAKYKGEFGWKLFTKLLAIIAVASIVLLFGCVIASHILIQILYPDSYEMAKEFFWISSASQVVFFATSVLMVVLLRFSKQSYQLYINLIYAAAFLVLGIPLTQSQGIWGFSYAILFANLIRMVVSILFGAFDQNKKRLEK